MSPMNKANFGCEGWGATTATYISGDDVHTLVRAAMS